jgi:hypothetical protein
MNFTTTITNHPLPAVSVIVADDSGVTYNEVKNSLGNQVYQVNGLYLYSSSISQLIGAIKYQRFDVSGNQDISSIVTAIDPYQDSPSLVVDLKNFNTPIILNGNSSVATTLQPNVFLQVKFLANRITNSFGMNLENFREMDRITRTKFFENYGHPIEEIQQTNKKFKNITGDRIAFKNFSKKKEKESPLPYLYLIGFGVGLYFFTKK